MSIKTSFRRGLLVTSGLAAILGAGPSRTFAAEFERGGQIEEVIVTAQKRAENLQNVPISVTVINGQTLAEQSQNSLVGLSQSLPAVHVGPAGNSTVIYIRGIGNSNVNNGSDPDVTTQVDGVYIARPSSELFDYLDVERIEVLRGPQGTLYGRNAVGGTMNIISRKPGDEFHAAVNISGGSFGLFQTQNRDYFDMVMRGDFRSGNRWKRRARLRPRRHPALPRTLLWRC